MRWRFSLSWRLLLTEKPTSSVSGCGCNFSLSHVKLQMRIVFVFFYCLRCAGLKWLEQKWLKTPKSAWVLTISIQVCCSDFNHILNLDFYSSSNGRAQSFQYIWYCGGVAAQWFSSLRLWRDHFGGTLETVCDIKKTFLLLCKCMFLFYSDLGFFFKAKQNFCKPLLMAVGGGGHNQKAWESLSWHTM